MMLNKGTNAPRNQTSSNYEQAADEPNNTQQCCHRYSGCLAVYCSRLLLLHIIYKIASLNHPNDQEYRSKRKKDTTSNVSFFRNEHAISYVMTIAMIITASIIELCYSLAFKIGASNRLKDKYSLTSGRHTLHLLTITTFFHAQSYERARAQLLKVLYRESQKDYSNKPIMRHFIFFITCLALL
jgi:hypothetical protein